MTRVFIDKYANDGKHQFVTVDLLIYDGYLHNHSKVL